VLVEDAHRSKATIPARSTTFPYDHPEILRAKVSVFADSSGKQRIIAFERSIDGADRRTAAGADNAQSAEERLREYAIKLERSNLELQQLPAWLRTIFRNLCG